MCNFKICREDLWKWKEMRGVREGDFTGQIDYMSYGTIWVLYHIDQLSVKKINLTQVVAGVQPQQDPGVPSEWTASSSKGERPDWRGVVKSGKSLFFYRSFYILS